MLILKRKDIEQLIDVAEVTNVVEKAFEAHGLGEVVMPPKLYLSLPQYKGDFRAMPAYVRGASGVKWVNSHPFNPSTKGLPTVMAVLVYNDPETGLPLAVMDATSITKYRTAAASAIATKWLARRDVRSLGVIGCGAQAGPHIKAISLVRDFKEIRVFDKDPKRVEALADSLEGLPVKAVSREVAAACDVVCTITPGYDVVFWKKDLRAGQHINAVGADAPEKQEFEAEALKEVKLYVDDMEQACHSGEVSGPLEHGVIGRDHIRGTIGQIVAGKVPGRQSADEITMFDSTGLAIQDIATAAYLYEKARREKVGLEVDLL
ncbi:MAG TPA: ornithine cyclodeaminase family protein [Firmicutes bacterium]|nr:ornithine cyclodeaminase family protein [Bacillota bacterium]